MLSLEALPNPCKNSVIYYRYVRYWSDLPKDLLEIIFNHLKRSVGDLIRVSSVCKSWQLVSDSVRQQEDETGPFFVLLPPTKYNIAHDQQQQQLIIYHLLDFFKYKEVDKLSDTHDHNHDHDHCSFISRNEWLVILNRGPYELQIRIINLLSMARVELPSPTSIDHLLHFGVRKVALSSTPSDPNCVFMAIYMTCETTLAFCKQGDKGWKFILRGERFGYFSHNSYRDVIYFKGRFYAVAVGGYLDACDAIDSLEPKLLNVVTRPITNIICHKDTLYLVESSGDLLLVIRTSEYIGNNGNDNGVSETFQLYKLNFRKRKWQRINSLRDNSAIFVGRHVSMSVSAKDFPVKRDCIYFNDDANRCHDHDIGVFNLKTNLFEPTFLFSRKWPSSIYWVSL